MSAIPAIALFVALWGLLPAARRWPASPGFTALAAWSLLGPLLAVFGLRGGDLSGFAQDSLFTLQPWGQAGVVAIAAGLMLAGAWLADRLARRICDPLLSLAPRLFRLAANLALTLAGTTLAWLLSPQIFYSYYRLIFPGLPSQWVIHWRDGLAAFVEALALGPGASLAATATGVLFWGLAALTITLHAVQWRRPPDD